MGGSAFMNGAACSASRWYSCQIKKHKSRPAFLGAQPSHVPMDPNCARMSSIRSFMNQNSSDNDNVSPMNDETTTTTAAAAAARTKKEPRAELLHEELTKLGVNASDLSNAYRMSFLDPHHGYDPKYGKSAIKTYKSYVSPKNRSTQTSDSILAGSIRTARQIDFLIKKHKSQKAEWVRHTDDTAKRTRTFPLILVLDNVRSAFNVGSILRTADACGCAMVITTGITPHPNGSGAEKVGKSALGADLSVPTRHFGTVLEAVAFLRESEVFLVAMETTERSECYTDVTYPKEEGGGTALFLGNEVSGVDTEIIDLLDAVVEIPMFGTKNSLNIAASAPVVMYEVLRQWGALDSADNK
eukprot:CAMPEP_0195508874 /NCGR_PEP_ID=MMETSP0794_2-20130614/1969_1 /TAXON_ID=515487 /ORGANISM="Stephanopyxis turris, Strain CCMP 815" /LENGTH=355 /DNA_ID=CAMNT_0040635955 /DNA_START=239 /DNA_END=1306 /DNA_ORIENTATION=+